MADLAPRRSSSPAFRVAVQFAFNRGRIVAFVYPLTALALDIGAGGADRDDRVRARAVWDAPHALRPESVVAEVLKWTDSDLRPAASRRGTVLFTDLRGFDRPEHLFPRGPGLINSTQEVVGASSTGGTLVSHMGDGVRGSARRSSRSPRAARFDAAADPRRACHAGTSGSRTRACRAASGWGSA
jgi:hypothetical protein